MICDANKSKCKHQRYIVSTVHTVYSTILASELVYSGHANVGPNFNFAPLRMKTGELLNGCQTLSINSS